MFYDTSYHTVDAKNRVFLPKRFQQELGRDAEGNVVCYLTLGLESACLFLFSEEGFRLEISGLITRTFSGPEERTMQRLLASVTQKVQLDASGRLLIPENLRQRAGIAKEVAMVGAFERGEIWPRERWDAFQAENEACFGRLDKVLGSTRDRAPAEGSP